MASYKKVLIQGDNISHLSNDSNYSTFSGSYNDLSSKPSIPTHTSHLTNNSGFLTSHQSLSGYMPLSGTSFTGDVNLGTSSVSNKITLGNASWTNWYRLNKYWTEFSNNQNEGFKFISGGTESYVQFQINNRNQSGGNGVSSVTAYGSIYMNQNKKVATEEYVTSRGYLTSHQSLSGYATQSWVNSQGFLKSETDSQTLSISGKSLSISGGNSVTLPFFDGNYNSLSNKPSLFDGNYNSLSNKPSIPSLSGYATQSWVNSQGFRTTDADTQDLSISGRTISLTNGGSVTVPASFNGTQNTSGGSEYIIPKGSYTWSHATTPQNTPHGLSLSFVRSNEGWENYGTIVNWRTYPSSHGGIAQIYTPYGTSHGGDKLKYRLGNYSSAGWSSWKTIADTAWVEAKGYLTSHQSLSGYATQSWVNSQGFLKSQTDSQTLSISGKTLTISSGNSITLPTDTDASTLSGLSVHTGTNNHANKIVRTQANGYIMAGWINTPSGDAGTNTMTRITASYDGYLRYYTPTNFGKQIAQYIDYSSLSNKPSLFDGNYNSLSNRPSLFDGNYNSLSNKPTIPTNNNQLTNGAGFITGLSYANLTSKPTHVVNGMLSGRATNAPDTVGDSLGVTFNYMQSNATNRPTGVDHSLMTMAYSSAWQTQIAQDWRNKGRMYIRSQENGTWGSWGQVWSSHDFSNNSSNWNTAYNHSQSAHAPSNADATPSWVPSSDPGYLTSHQSLSGYATQSWVNSQGFLKSQTDSQTLSISGKTLTISSGNSVTLPFFDGNYNSLSNKPSIPSLSGYATQSWVNSQGFGTSSFSGSYNDLSNKPTIPSATGNAYNVNSQTITPTKVQIQSGDRRDKISLWGGSTYGIGMTSGCTLGAVNDYVMTFQMNNDTDRGFWWGHSQDAVSSGAMSLTTDGQLYVAKQIQVGRGRSHTSALGSSIAMEVYGNMSIVSGTLYIGGSGYTNTDFNKGITAYGWGDHDGLYLGASAKAADSSKLDGLSLNGTTNNAANRVVRTDGNGYANFGWINTSSGATTSTIDRIYASYDGYIRYVTKAEFGKQMSSYIDYAQLSGKPTIPTNNNQLTNGAGYSTFSGSYNDLTNKPTIPSAVTNNNQLTNGAGYITSHGIGSTTNLACNALTTSGNLVVNGTATFKANTTINATLQVNGNVGYTGTLKRNSDLRLKKDIKPIEKPLEKLSKIRGVDFTWKNNDTKSGGVIAQEVERAMPDYVHDLDTGYKTVDYDALIGVLIESVKELKQKVDNCNCNCKGE